MNCAPLLDQSLLQTYTIILSAHARKRMLERNISLKDVLEAVKSPVQVYYDSEKDVYLLLGSNNVAVVAAIRGARIEIVTLLRRVEYEALIGRLKDKRYKLIC